MKKLFLLSFLVALGTTTLNAQNWFSAEHSWIFNLSGGFAGFNEDFEMVAEKDTLVKGQAARKWVFHFSGLLGMEPKFTYSDGPRAYSFVAALDSFVKIYDFSMEVGDQLKIPRAWGSFAYKVESIDQVQAGNLSLKRQRARYINADGTPSDWTFDILENIGMVGQALESSYPTCSFVLLPDYECGSIVDGFDIKFICFSTPQGSFNPFNGTCSLVSANEPVSSNFKLAPNPAGEYFEILDVPTGAVLQSVVLTDLSGRVMRSWEGSQVRFSLQNLPAAVYVVEARFRSGEKALKKLVKLQ